MKNFYLLAFGLFTSLASFAQPASSYIIKLGGPTLPITGQPTVGGGACGVSGQNFTNYGFADGATLVYPANTGAGSTSTLSATIGIPSSPLGPRVIIYRQLNYRKNWISAAGQCGSASLQSQADLFNITITVIPDLAITATFPSNICTDGAALNLYSYINTASGVTFRLDGNVIGSSLAPSSMSAGSHSITAAYPFANGTTTVDYGTFTVSTPYGISFSPPSVTCGDATGALNMNSYVSSTPGGGAFTFSGPGISGSGFNPVASGNGTHTITAIHTNPQGCVATTTATITVVPTYTVNAGSNQQVCTGAAGISLLPGSSPSGGSWSGSGVSGSTFTPGALAVGLYTITYTTNVSGCIKSATKTVQILALPTVEAGSDIVACDNAGTIPLNTAGVAPTGGTWSFSNASFNFRINNGLGTVDVNNLAAGPYTLIYSSTNGSGCTNTDTRTLTINAKPVVDAGLNEQACVNGTNITLTGFTPPGGSWSGPGILPASVIFSPSTAGVGTHIITYSFTNGSGCTNTDTKEIQVNAVPVVSAGSDFSACITGIAIALGGSPSGGTWIGNGVSAGTFTASAAGLGTHNLTYNYTNSVTGCSGSDIAVVTVVTGPTVEAGFDINTCEAAATFGLTGATPGGGNWSGTGVISNQFSPVLSGIGSFVLTYNYTDLSGCSGSDTRTVIVAPLPTVNAGNNLQVCYNGGLVNLNDVNVSPAGGVWSGTGVTGNSFNPVTAGQSNHILTYTYTSPAGCTRADTREVFVFSTTPVNAGSDQQVCQSVTSLTLTGESPLGGAWSGTAVTGNIFNPSAAGVGVFIITYTVTDGNGCPNVDTRSITVNPSPGVTAGGNQVACVSSSSLQLTGATPTGGTWSGLTVLGDIFNPSLAGVGTFTVTYSFTNLNGCTASANKSVTVNPLPVVTVGSSFEACVNGTNITLTGALPVGGSWSGPGVTSGQFNPGTAGVGNHVLTYSFTNGQGCTNTAPLNVVVNPLPTVNAGIDIGTCANVTSLTLTGASPVGGVWSGPGVTAGIFNATVAGIGTHIIRYTFTDAKGCVNFDERNITVTSAPNVDAGPDQAVCVNQGAFTIVGGSPGGGTWSGTGVFANSFDPALAGVGTFVLTYSFNNGVGCSGTDTRSIQVKDISVVNAGSDLQYCINAGVQNLTGATPAGGAWSGPGVTGTTFNPFSATAGTHILTYSYTNPQGCTSSDTRQVLVFAAPVVNAGIDLTTCVNEPSLSLTGASPSGGSWSGTAVTGNSFNANAAGVGVHVITYSYTDGNSCTVTDSRLITVNTLPAVNAGADFGTCIDSPSALISGFSPTGGIWTGAGVAGANFIPALAGVGVHTLTYTFSTGTGCTVMDTRIVTVSALPTVNAGLDMTLCANSAIANLVGATPSGGVWSGSGVVGSSFNPGIVGAGVFEITYIYTNPATGCINTDTRQVVVNAIPVVNAGIDLQSCATDIINLTGASPAGGTWTGTGITGSQFRAVDAGVGTHVLTYTVTGGNGCQNSDTRDMVVNPLPVVSAGGDLVVCINTPSFSISGGTPFNGVWSGNGVNSNTFSASTAGVGNHDLIYTVTDAKGCINTDIKRITVTALPVVNAGVDQSICQNDGIQSLTGFSPVGGSWSGNGVSGSTFNPLITGVGSFTLTYTYTDANGCSAADAKTIIVNALPVVNAGSDLVRCINDSFTLTGASPSGGSWSGPGISGNTFNAAIAGIGTHIISYSYTNAQNCSVIDQREITVNALPGVNAGNDIITCKNQNVLLNDGFPNGGTWSGTGVSGNTFNATLVAAGIYTLTYTYINITGCQNSDTRVVTVNALPVVDAGIDLTLCLNSGVISLTGNTPAGGTWSGSGISVSTFNPSVSGTGSFTITYTYSDGNGCTGSDSRNIIVNSLPGVNAGLDLNRCLGDSFILSGASPSGGTWSGFGISGNSFIANDAGLGTHSITYTITGGNGCQNSDVRDIVVNALPNVSAGIDLVTCQNQNLSLNDGFPVNGVWSGPGITGNTFTPSLAVPGANTITYSYTNPTTGCSASDTRIISVNPLPIVNAGVDITTCINGGLVALTGATPAGGTWSGTGVSGTSFNPTISGLGSFTVTYTFLDANSCTASDTRTVIVNSLTSVNAGLDLSRCMGDVITLTGGSPSGGTWSGPGVSGNIFTASDAGIGTHTITYTILGGNGCQNTDTRDITVNALPTVDAGINLTTCQNQNITLNDGSPSLGTWSGPGITGNVFNPSISGAGIHTITYSYTNSITGCMNSDTRQITVNALPIVFAGSNLVFCANDGIALLSGASPAGGTWSGTGVVGSTFNPSTAGVGVFIVTYTYTDGNTCTKAATREVLVNSLPTVNAGLDNSICFGASLTLTGQSPSGGTWSGVAVSGNVFNSGNASVGITTLTYTVIGGNGCANSDSRNVDVKPIPVVQAGTNVELCIGSPSTTITGGTPSGGAWSGPGVSGNQFIPSSAGLGNHTVTYSYIDNGCSNTASKIISVVSNPTVDAGSDLALCVDGGIIALSGATPSGGAWSGPGVTGSNFNPSVAGVGVHVITYTYSAGAGCTNSDTRQVTVRAKPTVTAGSNSQVCAGSSVNLTGASPIGGTWIGPGVSGTTFNANIAGIGTHTLTYSYIDVNGCSNSATRQIEVLVLPTVLAGADQSVCANGGLLTLQDGVPSGGIWTGVGVSNGRLDPTVSGVGTFPVVYTFINPQGCSNSATKNVVVKTIPFVDAGNDQTYCLNSALVILSGATPGGGSWSGAGVSGSTFTPSLAGIGNHVITYSYTNAQGCSGTDTRQFLVQPAPVVTAGSNLAVCSSQVSVNLSGGNPFGGIWSGPFVNGSSFNASQAGAGVHLVQYLFTNVNGCTASANKEIVVNAGPNVEAGPNAETCSGADPVLLSGATPAGGTWSGNGVVGSEFRPKNVSIGSHTLTYSFTDGNGCAGTDTKVITVNTLPNVNAGTDKSLCEGSALYDLRSDASPSGGSFSGTGVTNTSFNPLLSGTGSFNIVYSYSDLNGCIASDSRLITVIPGLPQPTITGPSTVCYDATGAYQATAIGANTFTSYRWYLEGDVTPFAEGRSMSLKIFEDITIYVDAVNRDGCSSKARGEFEILVQTISGRIVATKNEIETGEAVGFEFSGTVGTKYTWDFGDRTKAYSDKPYHYFYFPGSYDIRLDMETSQGCKKTYVENNFVFVTGQPVDVVTGTEPPLADGIQVFPMPFTTELNVMATLVKSGSIQVHLYSQIGVKVKSHSMEGNSGDNRITIDGSDLAQGLYILEVTVGGEKVVKKIIKL